MNDYYYGLATDAKGVNYVLQELPETHIKALNEAKLRCKEQGLIFQTLRPSSNKQRGGNVLTKYAKERAIVNGKLGRIK